MKLKKIKALESEDIITYSTVLEHKVTIPWAHYNEQSASNILNTSNKLKQALYDQVKKAGTLLAWKIKTWQFFFFIK